MAHPALAGAEVALPEPPSIEGASAGPAGDDFPHVVTLCNAKYPGLSEQAFTEPAFIFPGSQVLAGWANFKVLSCLFPPQGATVSNSSANPILRKDAHLPDAAIPSGSPAVETDSFPASAQMPPGERVVEWQDRTGLDWRRGMSTPEERQREERRLRTERQRERRRDERICGNCRDPADGGLIEWAGRGEPLRIPVCRGCREWLERRMPRWSEVRSHGVWCPVQMDRPCPDCVSGTADRPPRHSLFRRLLGGG